MTQVVLLAEDHDDSREMYAQALQRAGYEVHAVSSPGEALVARLSSVDVVVLDYAMPKMTGAELAFQLRSSPASAAAKFVLLTGHGPDAMRDSAKKVRFDAMLKKPLAPEQLVRVVRHLLKG